MPDLHVFPDQTALAEAAATRIAQALTQAIEAQDRASLVLAGGSTPEPVYRRLAAAQADALDWTRVHVFFGDERCVPLDHEESNYRMAQEAFLDDLSIPEAHIHPMRCTGDPKAAADAYAETLRAFFGDEQALFDVTLLGLGADGHTASLFPDSDLLTIPNGWVSHAQAPQGYTVTDRLTLTLPALSASRLVLFLVSGISKREALAETLQPTSGDLLPAARVRPVGSVEWFLDEAARGDT